VTQHEARHPVGELARQLRPPTTSKEVDDREVIVTLARGLQSLLSAAGDLHRIALLPQDEGKRLGVAGIVFHQ
jgi:hypothetical protein